MGISRRAAIAERARVDQGGASARKDLPMKTALFLLALAAIAFLIVIVAVVLGLIVSIALASGSTLKALAMIVRAGEGSARDNLSLLDQAIALGGADGGAAGAIRGRWVSAAAPGAPAAPSAAGR